MNAREFIEVTKRGARLEPRDVAAFVDGFVGGAVPDYQAAAWLMAVWFRGLRPEATDALVRAMLESGRVLDLGGVPGPKIDKHSTGGVGDKISLPLAGVAAACGLRVPMISGRGLGHTGGTLDKLEAIPGYRTRFDAARFTATLERVGASIVGQSDDLVPADRALYALRDVTATVDCVPLIVASILSKKFAAGVDGVVLDVKVGSGAFMRDLDAARVLAAELARVAAAFGKRLAVLFTRMDEPLGVAVGNAIEVVESVEVLQGRGPDDVRRLTLVLAGEMLALGGLAPDAAAGERAARRALDSGAALAKFQAMVEAHGGRLDAGAPDCGLHVAPRAAVVAPSRAAWLAAVDGAAVGLAVVDLGGGRQRAEDAIDPSVGLRWRARVGQHFEAGEPIAEILAPAGPAIEAAAARLRAALSWSDAPVEAPPLVLGRIVDPGGKPA